MDILKENIHDPEQNDWKIPVLRWMGGGLSQEITKINYSHFIAIHTQFFLGA